MKKDTSMTKNLKKPLKEDDLPVTKRLFDLKIQEVKGETNTLRLEMKAGFSKIDTQLTKMMVMLEEQNNRNRVALDGYTVVYEKLQEHDLRFEKIERHIFAR